MLHVTVDAENNIAVLEPEGRLTETDFVTAARSIEEHLQQAGRLNGIIIHTRQFPGWASFKALLAHFKFVKNHHREVTRIALVTDSTLADIVESLGGHFLAAEIRHFAFTDMEQARAWINEQAA